jgi:predicted phage terminase large subunit-like protein
MAVMTIPTVAELRALLRADFGSFIERCFYQLNPSAKFLPNWHHEVIASKLDDCRRGKVRRLIINVPPRSLKSLAASIAFPAWVLGHNPSAQLLCVSYAQDLWDKFARECRSVMVNDWYRRPFSTRLSPQKQAVEEFVTTANGYRLATSVGGVITGRGADYIIIDDPLKPEYAESEAQRKAANQWYDNTLYSRLNDKRTGCIILIMQRLHEDDLVGHVLGQEAWEVLRFPAVAEAAEQFVVTTRSGVRTFTRNEGDVLHSEREPLTLLQNIRKTLGERNFAGQYQQAPAPPEGNLVQQEWFRRYAPNEQPKRFEQVIQSWDTANKVSELSDYSVCTTWGIRARQIYLLDVFRQRLEFPELKRAVKERAASFKASVILIEDRASGTQLIQELRRDGLYQVQACKSAKDKIMRLHAQTPKIEGGFVYLPRDAPWLAEYLHELTTFPGAKYDDQADSTSQAMEWMIMKSSEPAIIAFYRLEVAKMRFQQSQSVDTICRDMGITRHELQDWLEFDPRNYDDEDELDDND